MHRMSAYQEHHCQRFLAFRAYRVLAAGNHRGHVSRHTHVDTREVMLEWGGGEQGAGCLVVSAALGGWTSIFMSAILVHSAGRVRAECSKDHHLPASPLQDGDGSALEQSPVGYPGG